MEYKTGCMRRIGEMRERYREDHTAEEEEGGSSAPDPFLTFCGSAGC
jgi:hypothetical protein